jgi:oligopeptide/dipeptide ABC transporter ATP-binding protein
MTTPILSVRNLRTWFHLDEGVLKAVDGVNFDLMPGQTLGIIGESGSGKSVTARSIMRLVSSPGKIEAGSQIMLNAPDRMPIDIAKLENDSHDLRTLRGRNVAMIFQEPMTSLSPVHKVGDQIAEAALLHVTTDIKEAREMTAQMLARVGIPSPEERMQAYPFELSGGLRQRVMIAMALVCRPVVLIADEPTTALDVTVQWQILRLLAELRAEFGMSILYITHDLGVIAQIADVMAVMYLGQVVETGDVVTLFEQPLHPYTRALLRSIPTVGGPTRSRLEAIAGTVPMPINLPRRCRFADRCPAAFDKCFSAEPALVDMGNGHAVRCFLHSGKVEEAGASGNMVAKERAQGVQWENAA